MKRRSKEEVVEVGWGGGDEVAKKRSFKERGAPSFKLRVVLSFFERGRMNSY